MPRSLRTILVLVALAAPFMVGLADTLRGQVTFFTVLAVEAALVAVFWGAIKVAEGCHIAALRLAVALLAGGGRWCRRRSEAAEERGDFRKAEAWELRAAALDDHAALIIRHLAEYRASRFRMTWWG